MNNSHDNHFSPNESNVEASVNTFNATSPMPCTIPSIENQTAHLQQPLSLRIEGLSAVTVVHGEGNLTPTYTESSERGSETSVDGRRPDLSASTLADSLFSFPSSTNSADQTKNFDDTQNLNDPITTLRTDQDVQDTHMAPQTQPVNGGSIDRWQPSLSPIKAGETSLQSPFIPKHSHSRTKSNFDAGLASTQNGAAAGDYRSHLDNPVIRHTDLNGAARRRSKSTGASLYGSRIAQLSVHIRSRLSYAAAKIENARQSPSRGVTPQIEFGTHQNASPLNSSAPSDIASLPAGRSTPFSFNSQTSSNGTSYRPMHNRSRSAFSSEQYLPIPKLAPPVDIISSNGQNQRRRPNPNAISKSTAHSPIARHRRNHSYQDNGLNRPFNCAVVGPGAPSLPSTHANAPTSAPNGLYGGRTPSANTLMEQDAIETLMSMSSPENSGYRFSPRPLQHASTQSSLNGSVNTNNSTYPNESQGSQSSESHNSRNLETKPGLESRAGDDIDRLLDQMDSDSEDEGRYESVRRGIRGAHPFRHPR